MNIFQATGQVLTSFTTVFVTTATTLEKTVKLVEREIDNLTTEQQIRMDAINHEQQIKLDKLKATLKTTTNN